MTLAHILNETPVTEKVAEDIQVEKSKYLENSIIDKLASSLESFVEKEAGPNFDRIVSKVERSLGTQTPIATDDILNRKDIIDANLSKRDLKGLVSETDYSIHATEIANQLAKKQKRLKALREGTFLAKNPWVLPAVLGAGGGLILSGMGPSQSPQQGVV